jgi:hypothetical protein
MELRHPWNSARISTEASFKDGDNSTDPRRCTAHARQTGKRCKNASIPGGRVCRYHGGAAPHVQKKANDRLRELEHPAIDAIARSFDPAPKKGMQQSTVLAAAKDILDRTGHKTLEKVEVKSAVTVDVTKLSTSLLRRLRDEILQQQARAALLTSPTPAPASPDRRPMDLAIDPAT